MLTPVSAAALMFAAALAAPPAPLQADSPKFTKHVIDAKFPAISAAALDVDGDGRLDVVAAGGPSGGPSEWSNLVVWYKAPNWEKREVATLDKKAVLLHVEAVDFIGPGGGQRPPQFIATDGQLGHVWWCWFTRDQGKWRRSLVVDNAPYAHGSAAGDIDGDGWQDVLCPYQNGPGKIGLLWAKNPGSDAQPPAGAKATPWQTFPLAEKFDIGGWLHYVRLVDLNGDQKLDALLGSDGDAWSFGYWLQGADPAKPWEPRVLAGPMKKGTNLDAADLDGDGRIDLVGSEGHGRGLWWFPGPDFKPARIDDTLEAAHSLAIGDLDGDGKPDLASCGYENKTVAIFLNRGGGKFERVVIDADQAAYDMRAVDLDGDGDLDLLLSGQNSGNLVWYENAGQ